MPPSSRAARAAIALTVALLTLAGLEGVLALTGAVQPDFTAADRVDSGALQPVPWWVCDATACRFDGPAFARTAASPDAPASYRQTAWLERLHLINPQGFHDRDAFARPPENAPAYRLLVLGDSFAFGFGAPLGRSWVELAEADLQARGPVLLWNAGIPGTGTQQALALMRAYGPLLAPDVVVLGFTAANDFDDNLYPVDSVMALSAGLLLRGYRLDAAGIAHPLTPLQAYRRARGGSPPGYAGPLEFALRRTRVGTVAWKGGYLLGLRAAQGWADVSGASARRDARAAQVTEDLLRRLRDEAAASGGQLWAVVIAHPSDYRPGGPGEDYRRALALFDRLGIPVLDTYPALTPADYASDGHWNENGHRRVASLLLEALPPP